MLKVLGWFTCIGGRTFLLVNNSSLMKFAQMYEFIAENPKEKKKYITCMHAHIHARTHTYIHAYIHTHILGCFVSMWLHTL